MTSVALRERLRRAVGQQGVIAPPPPRPATPKEAPLLSRALGGEWLETRHGPVFLRDDWLPLHHMHGSLPMRAPLDATPEALACLLGAEAAPHPERLAFFDIETTGLSGGTGTYVFLAGLGSFEDGAFRLRQYFLADLAHERAMLAMLADDLARCHGLVTYNGRAFDMPFVQTRMTLARVGYPCAASPHFDLLHVVRRLYGRRMPGCRLAEAERRLLRIERFDDVPGWQIPSLYLDFVRAGRVAPLGAVFRHNADDVLSLVGVLAALAGLFSNDNLDADDMAAVARWWELAGQPLRAAALYRRALPWLEGGEHWAWTATRHAVLCRRAGEREEAAGLWHRLWDGGDRLAALELAKHLEHYARDLPAAEEVTRALLVRPEEGERITLEHRLARISRKIASRLPAARAHGRAASSAGTGR